MKAGSNGEWLSTTVSGNYTLLNGTNTDAATSHAPLSNVYYCIVPDKCTECQGFHEQPQCADVCPVECCVPDEMYHEQ